MPSRLQTTKAMFAFSLSCAAGSKQTFSMAARSCCRTERCFGRVLLESDRWAAIDCIAVAGSDLHFWYADASNGTLPSFVASHLQAFDEGTIRKLQRLCIGVVGASGTGSPAIEQLVRLGVGSLVIVDNDVMAFRNVNRILNSTMRDVRNQRFKVDVLADAAERTELGTQIIRNARNLWNPNVVRELAQCDILFSDAWIRLTAAVSAKRTRDILLHSLFRHRRAP